MIPNEKRQRSIHGVFQAGKQDGPKPQIGTADPPAGDEGQQQRDRMPKDNVHEGKGQAVGEKKQGTRFGFAQRPWQDLGIAVKPELAIDKFLRDRRDEGIEAETPECAGFVMIYVESFRS